MPPELAAPVRDVEPAAVDLLHALADPTRRRIFLLVMRGEICNCELAAELDLPQNLVSHHLRKLREAGLVEEHRDASDARWIHQSVNVGGLSAAWEALSAALDPARLGTRIPGCGWTGPCRAVGERPRPHLRREAVRSEQP